MLCLSKKTPIFTHIVFVIVLCQRLISNNDGLHDARKNNFVRFSFSFLHHYRKN